MHASLKHPVPTALAALFLVSLLAGCGGGGGTGPFAACGNGRLDAGEQCDDGNLSDNDDCLSTCVRARCGDTFVNSDGTAKEDCDGTNLGSANCVTLGFNPGTLRCTADCRFDTSGCPARPTASPTATHSPSPTATPTLSMMGTPTGTPNGPTPTATPVVTCESVTVTVRLVYDVDAAPELAGLVVDLNYPAVAVSIPGTGSDDSVVARVTDVSGARGFSSLDDRDASGDGQDDQLRNVYATGGNIPPGDFEQVVFDCNATAPVPDPGAFTCAVSDAVDPQAFPVEGVTCAVAVGTP